MLINSSFTSLTFPRALKRAEVFPHPKDGDHEVPDNNRPISLLPVLSKVTGKNALRYHNDYLTRNNKLTQHKSGNRKFHSTESLSLLVTDDIFKAIDQKKLTAMVLTKCYHNPMCKQHLGTSRETLKWFEIYLTDCQQSTRVGISLSHPLTVTHGVPQGSILGPMLFNLYMNDLPSVVKFSCVESYFDHTKIYLSFWAKDLDTCMIQVIEDLRNIASWCCTNSLLINPRKTKFIFFGVRQLVPKVADIHISFLSQELVPKPYVTDFGILLDSNLSFNEHTASLVSTLLGTLCRINKIKHLFSRSAFIIILNSLVFSKLFYCSTVWADTSKQNIIKLQLLQNFVARILTNKENMITFLLLYVSSGGSLSKII